MPSTVLPGVVRVDENSQVDALHQLFNNNAISTEALALALRKMSPSAVTDTAQRGTLFPAPSQGDRVFRMDLGYTEVYLAAYNATTNPGGAAIAGWYPLDSNIYARAIRPTDVTALSATEYTTFFESAVQTYPGMFSSANQRRIIMPVIGLWELEGFATTSGLDGGVLRSWIRINGTSYNDLRDNVSGVSGVTDPFVKPRGIVNVTNTTSYAELIFNESGKTTATLKGDITLWARYLGPNRAVPTN